MKPLQGFVSLANVGIASPDGGSCTTIGETAKIRVATWPAPVGVSARGTVIVAQGYGECIEKYYEVVKDLRARGFAVIAFDWRGQGGSERVSRKAAKAHMDAIDDLVEDLVAVVGFAREQRRLPKPIYLLAHSMGGLVALMAAAKISDHVERMALVSPLIRPARMPIPTELVYAIALLAQGFGFGRVCIPGVGRRLQTGFEKNRTTSDQKRFAKARGILEQAPYLIVSRPTFGWASAILSATSRLTPVFASRVAIPTLVVAAGRDEIVSKQAIERFAEGLRAGGCLRIPGAKHEILMERDVYRLLFWAAFDAFIPGTGHSRLDGTILRGEDPLAAKAAAGSDASRKTARPAAGGVAQPRRREADRTPAESPDKAPREDKTRAKASDSKETKRSDRTRGESRGAVGTENSEAARSEEAGKPPGRGHRSTSAKAVIAAGADDHAAVSAKRPFLLRRVKPGAPQEHKTPAAGRNVEAGAAANAAADIPAGAAADAAAAQAVRPGAGTDGADSGSGAAAPDRSGITADLVGDDDFASLVRISEAARTLKSVSGSDAATAGEASKESPGSERLKARLKSAKQGRRTSKRRSGV